MAVSKKENPIDTETEEVEDDDIPTPWECVFYSLCSYLSEDLAFEAACQVCDDLNEVMHQIPRPGHTTRVAIIARHPNDDEPLEWQASADISEMWY